MTSSGEIDATTFGSADDPLRRFENRLAAHHRPDDAATDLTTFVCGELVLVVQIFGSDDIARVRVDQNQVGVESQTDLSLALETETYGGIGRKGPLFVRISFQEH